MRKTRIKVALLLCCLYTIILAVILSKSVQKSQAQYIGVSKTFEIQLKEPLHPDDTSPSGVNVLLLPARVNAIGCSLLLDTGAAQSILSERLSKSLKLSGEKIRVPRGSNLRSQYVYKAEVLLDVGEIELSEFRFIVLNLEHLSDGFSVPIQGVLGSDFLNRFIYSLNVNEKKLRFCAEDDINNVDTIPIKIRHNLIFQDLQIDGKSVEFLFDTGSSYTQISRDAARGFETEFRENEGFTLGINGRRETNKKQEVATIRDFNIGKSKSQISRISSRRFEHHRN